jgi:hypothetical protein
LVKITCESGNTQIEKMLNHASRENGRRKVQGMVFVSDAMEEDSATLYAIARELGQRGVPVFLFQEGGSSKVNVFGEIARLTKGAHYHFAPGADGELADLLRVAAYAAGGRQALQANLSAGAMKLLQHLK